MSVLRSLLLTLRLVMRTRAALQLEILALRHQLDVLERSRPRRLRLAGSDRLLWIWLSRVWQGWREAVVIVVIAWHRRGFRLFWRWKSRPRGRPTASAEVRTLIRTMSEATIPRFHRPEWVILAVRKEFLTGTALAFRLGFARPREGGPTIILRHPFQLAP